jgi:hypothetical protein
MAQLSLNFEPGLAERWSTVKACVRERVYANQKPLKAIAADMNLSPSELSRKLSENPDDTRDLSVDDLERFITATQDHTPIYYLIEKFAISTQTKQAYAAAELAKALPQILALAKALGTPA